LWWAHILLFWLPGWSECHGSNSISLMMKTWCDKFFFVYWKWKESNGKQGTMVLCSLQL